VLSDVVEGKVSPEAARNDYGVMLKPDGSGSFTIDAQATEALRAKLKAARNNAPAMIDRGSGFEKMLRGEVKPWVRSA
jgi:N-methylhydantoinase B